MAWRFAFLAGTASDFAIFGPLGVAVVQNLKTACADGWAVLQFFCCVAGCHGELGTNLFAGSNGIVAGVRQGDGEQPSAEPCAPGLRAETMYPQNS